MLLKWVVYWKHALLSLMPSIFGWPICSLFASVSSVPAYKVHWQPHPQVRPSHKSLWNETLELWMFSFISYLLWVWLLDFGFGFAWFSVEINCWNHLTLGHWNCLTCEASWLVWLRSYVLCDYQIGPFFLLICRCCGWNRGLWNRLTQMHCSPEF